MSRAGTQSRKYGYRYYAPILAARDAGLVWTDTNLDAYLRGPEKFLQAATGRTYDDILYMKFYIGGNEPKQVQARRDIIEYLKEIKGRACAR